MQNNLQETKDYKLVESLKDNYFQIQLLSGKFSDVIYKYGKVSFHEEKKQLRISYDYEIIETPIDISEDELRVNSEFTNHIANVLNSILLTENNFKIGAN